MDLKEVNERMISRHPWEKARTGFFIELYKRCAPKNCDKVLDVGSGDAYFSKNLIETDKNIHQIICWDVNYSDKQLSDASLRNVLFEREKPQQTFDAILLMDVMEHIENDYVALGEIVNDNLSKNGVIFFTVPAWDCLYSAHDVHLGHLRRYSPSSANKLLRECGLEIICSGGLFHSLLLVRLFLKILECSPKMNSSENLLNPAVGNLGNWKHGYLFTAVADFTLWCDNILSKVFSKLNVQFPGLSYWAVARVKKSLVNN